MIDLHFLAASVLYPHLPKWLFCFERLCDSLAGCIKSQGDYSLNGKKL